MSECYSIDRRTYHGEDEYPDVPILSRMSHQPSTLRAGTITSFFPEYVSFQGHGTSHFRIVGLPTLQCWGSRRQRLVSSRYATWLHLTFRLVKYHGCDLV